VKVCFTLSRDGKTWLEYGYRFVRRTGCPGGQLGVYSESPVEDSGPGFLIFDTFRARVRTARALGTIEDPDFCDGKKFQWTARATRPLPSEALATLGPSSTIVCKKPGIHYAGKSATADVEVCLTLKPDRQGLVEAGWVFEPESGCGDASVGGIAPLDVDATGHFEDPDSISGTIKGSRASGVLADFENCPSKTFRWSARRVP
jgi:hypothetical protein